MEGIVHTMKTTDSLIKSTQIKAKLHFLTNPYNETKKYKKSKTSSMFESVLSIADSRK
jgi:hypothetical protein